MSGCYWLRKFTLRGFLIGCLIWFGLTLGQQDCHASYDQPERQVAYEVADNHVRPPNYNGGHLTNLKPKDLCENARDREDRDLCQQWRMAQAAESQAGWTKAQFWITFAEIIGLVLVVVYSAKTARDAGRSAAAAEAIVKVSQETAERQLRAYVNFSGAEMNFLPTRKFVIKMVFHNTGQTPALNVQNACQVVVGDHPGISGIIDVPKAPSPTASICDVGAGMPITLSTEHPPALDEQTWDLVVGAKSPVYVIGEVRYWDVFRRMERTTQYRIVKPKGEGQFYPCREGNQST